MKNNITVVIGLTGPSGAGKSTVAMELAEMGCSVIDCDVTAHRVLEQDADCRNALVAAFGEDILDERGKIDRKVLGAKAFSSKENTQLLNGITHPIIKKKVLDDVRGRKIEKAGFIVLDAPTLIESGCDELCDFVVVVKAPEDVRLRRIMERDGITEEQAKARMSAQLSDLEYRRHADFTVNGDTQDRIRNLKLRTILKTIAGGYNE